MRGYHRWHASCTVKHRNTRGRHWQRQTRREETTFQKRERQIDFVQYDDGATTNNHDNMAASDGETMLDAADNPASQRMTAEARLNQGTAIQ